jgi:hypothetical protein
MEAPVRWPLLTIAAGLIMMQLGGRLGVRLASRWKRAHPNEALPFRDELGSAFVRENRVAWLLPIMAFGSFGLVLGGLLWLALVVFV